jgi:GntR family transcriptional regulator
VTGEEESAALGVPLHSPAFLFERSSRDEAGEIVEFVQSTYRGDRYRIVSDLGRNGKTPQSQSFVPRSDDLLLF